MQKIKIFIYINYLYIYIFIDRAICINVNARNKFIFIKNIITKNNLNCTKLQIKFRFFM